MTKSTAHRYLSLDTKRLTAIRRLEIVGLYLLGLKASALLEANEYGADEAEIRFWVASFKKDRLAGLKSGSLTAFAREQRRAA